MRILLIGPTGGGGSLPPYLNVLADGLRMHGAHVDRLGTPDVPYDPQASAFWPVERIVETAEKLLARVDLRTYDVLSIHYGNLEIEQLLPSLWTKLQRPPAVYHVHSLDWTLFASHVPDESLRSAVEAAIDQMDGFVFFGEYGRTQLAQRHDLAAPSVVSWLPTTIPPGTFANAGAALRSVLTLGYGPLASLYGYAAPWKDPVGLIKACEVASSPCQVLLAGPLWDNLDEAGVDLSREATTGVKHGAARVDVISDYLGPADRMALIEGTHFGVFPYRTQPTFQGSGAIADYLAHGTPILATDVANMTEVVGDAGVIVGAGDVEALASAIDRLTADDHYRDALSQNARRRSRKFSAAYHAAQCLRLYETAIAESIKTS